MMNFRFIAQAEYLTGTEEELIMSQNQVKTLPRRLILRGQECNVNILLYD